MFKIKKFVTHAVNHAKMLIDADKEIDQLFEPYRTSLETFAADRKMQSKLNDLTYKYNKVLRKHHSDARACRLVARQMAWQELDPKGWEKFFLLTEPGPDHERIIINIKNLK